jgi:hypothetical protein
MRYPLRKWQTFYPTGPRRIYGLRSIRYTRPVNLGHVTMLQATPYVLHFKRVVDFGEGHPTATFSHQLSTTCATLSCRASDAAPHHSSSLPPLDNQREERILPLDLQGECVYDRKAE